MQWHRLNILINRLAHEQDEMGVFHVKTDGTVITTQSGVIRTNCIDCLDRTNVVQSMLARRSLQQVLEKLNIVRVGQTIESVTAFDSLFKNVWADNADLISVQYSGTGALKTDFTRTGKRTIQGLFQDGINSLTRYFKNNFSDGYRQVSSSRFWFEDLKQLLGLTNKAFLNTFWTGRNQSFPWQLHGSRWWRKTHSQPIGSSKRMEASYCKFYLFGWKL